MNDLISKSELIKTLTERAVMHYEDWKAFKDYMGDRKVIHSSKLDECKMILDIIADVPLIENVSVIRGEFKLAFSEEENVWECSNCGKHWLLNDGTPFDNEMYFCPKCGMRTSVQQI